MAFEYRSSTWNEGPKNGQFYQHKRQQKAEDVSASPGIEREPQPKFLPFPPSQSHQQRNNDRAYQKRQHLTRPLTQRSPSGQYDAENEQCTPQNVAPAGRFQQAKQAEQQAKPNTQAV